MNYVFFGTPEFAAIILEKLINAGMPPAAVVCNPDRPVGRKKVLTAPPVKSLIMKHETWSKQIRVFQPNILDASFMIHVSSLKPDFFVVAAYAKILPREIIALPRLGTIGVHPSLLPDYRGPTPIQSAILNGETETGVTLFMLDEKVDHGPILANSQFLPPPIQKTYGRRDPASGGTIPNSQSYQDVVKKLAEVGGELLVETIPQFAKNEIKPVPQDERRATYTKKFTADDAKVDMIKDAPEAIWRKIRALNPEPGVFTMNYPGHEGKRVKLLAADFVDGALRITRIQVEGKKPRPA